MLLAKIAEAGVRIAPKVNPALVQAVRQVPEKVAKATGEVAERFLDGGRIPGISLGLS